MNGKRLKALTVTGLVVLALVAGTPGVASAADGWQPTRNVPDGQFNNDHVKACRRTGPDPFLARGCFQPYGEIFWLRDNWANGFPVVIRWRLYSGSRVVRAGDIYDTHGKAAGWTVRNKSFAENRKLRFRVCQVHLSSRDIHYCGRWREVRT